MSRFSRSIAHRVAAVSAAALAGLALAAGCREELVVVDATTVFADGAVERVVRIEGRTPDGEVPESDGWFADSAGLAIARPEAWDRIERRPGRIDVSGFFADAASVPPTLAWPGGDEPREDRQELRVEIETRGVLTRWVYVERHGDPFGPAERYAALSALAARLGRVVSEELRATFGEDLDVAPAERFFRDELSALVGSLFDARRAASLATNPEERLALQRAALERFGVPAVAVDADAEDRAKAFWDAQFPRLLQWARDRVARELSTPERTIPPEALSFWPVGAEWEATAEAVAERHFGSGEALWEELAPALKALDGRYGAESTERFRFERALRLPGTLLRTNGTPDRDAVRWLYRETDLDAGGVALTAVSVETRREALVALGATRDLDTAGLLRLEDLLFRRDTQGVLAERLERAIRAGDSDLLLSDQDDDPWAEAAVELRDLLVSE